MEPNGRGFNIPKYPITLVMFQYEDHKCFKGMSWNNKKINWFSHQVQSVTKHLQSCLWNHNRVEPMLNRNGFDIFIHFASLYIGSNLRLVTKVHKISAKFQSNQIWCFCYYYLKLSFQHSWSILNVKFVQRKNRISFDFKTEMIWSNVFEEFTRKKCFSKRKYHFPCSQLFLLHPSLKKYCPNTISIVINIKHSVLPIAYIKQYKRARWCDNVWPLNQ